MLFLQMTKANSYLSDSITFFTWTSNKFGQMNSVCLLVIGQKENLVISTALPKGVSIHIITSRAKESLTCSP